jgi:hypothetical protein
MGFMGHDSIAAGDNGVDEEDGGEDSTLIEEMQTHVMSIFGVPDIERVFLEWSDEGEVCEYQHCGAVVYSTRWSRVTMAMMAEIASGRV